MTSSPKVTPERRARLVMASFAGQARALAEACERASKGRASAADHMLILEAWEASKRGAGLQLFQTAEADSEAVRSALALFLGEDLPKRRGRPPKHRSASGQLCLHFPRSPPA